jgi:hypothetical protein
MGFTMKIAICFALALAVTSAQHAEDGVVPESTQEVEPVLELVDTSAEEAENAAAHQEAKSYLQKAGSDACKALADSAAKAVKDNVKAEQEILDKIDKGAKCKDEGQDAVNAMKKKLAEAKDAQKKANKKYDDAQNADVDFGKRKYSSLTKGNCDTFFNSQAFKNAKSKVNDAKKKKDQAAGTVSQAQKSVDTAEKSAIMDVRKCQCTTFNNHKKALAAANKSVQSANTKSWTKAAHLKCVLAGTPASSCTVPALPKVKATSVANGVDASKCEHWYNGKPIPSYCDTGFEAYKKSHGYTNSNSNWSKTFKSGSAVTPGKKFQLIRMALVNLSNSKAGMDKYVNICRKSGLLAVGCGDVNNYDAGVCPWVIGVPKSWGCNMMGNLKNKAGLTPNGENAVALLTKLGSGTQYLYTTRNGYPSGMTQPVCGKWV